MLLRVCESKWRKWWFVPSALDYLDLFFSLHSGIQMAADGYNLLRFCSLYHACFRKRHASVTCLQVLVDTVLIDYISCVYTRYDALVATPMAPDFSCVTGVLWQRVRVPFGAAGMSIWVAALMAAWCFQPVKMLSAVLAHEAAGVYHLLLFYEAPMAMAACVFSV